jgi:LPXTG-motif cell wall-anchored protein
MNKALAQRLTALFAIILLVVGNLSFVQPVIHAAALDNAVTVKAIDEDGEVILPLTAIEVEEGDNAYEVLLEAGEKNNKKIDASFGEYGAFINGIGGVTPSGDAYWSFNVNGVSSSVGASTHLVRNGEHLLFAITEWPTPAVSTKVSAVGKDGTEIIPETEVTLMKGASAYGALIQAAAKHGVDVNASVDGSWFTSIDNIGKTVLEEGDYWSFGINGTASEVGVVSYTVQPNDHIQLTIDHYLPPADPEPEEPEEPSEPVDPQPEPEVPVEEAEPLTDEMITNSMDKILSYMNANKVSLTYGNEWWVWGAANTTGEIPPSYVQSVKERVKSVEGSFRNVFDLEKVIIGLSAADANAASIEGYNLIDSLVSHRSLENPSINMNIYALLAVDSGRYETPEGFRDQMIKAILDLELEDGGWSFFGTNPSPDITGMALSALAPYRDQDDVQAAIDRAVSYLSKTQDETGGFDIEFNGGDSSESVSQAIIGLASVGVDPTGEKLTKSGGNLVQHLMKFQQADGGFSHLLDDVESSSMGTQQALLALKAYQNFVTGSGLVYQFKQDADEETPEQPEQPGEPGDTEQPEQPETEQPEKSGDSGQTENPGQAQGQQPEKAADAKNTNEKTKDQKNQGKKLPETGTNTMAIMLAGLGLLVAGFILFCINRKRTA